MTTITDVSTLTTEIVITPRVVSTEFKIVEITENIANRVVRVEIELGPFTSDNSDSDNSTMRGLGRRSVVAWRGDEYDAVRDTWKNADLIAQVTAKLQVI